VLAVLHSIEAISACKDRDRLPHALLHADGLDIDALFN
jgi:hypothetical protein